MQAFHFKRRVYPASMLALCGLLAAPAAHAEGEAPEGNLELGLFGGGHFFAKDVELGVADLPDLVPAPKDSWLVGARLGYVLTSRLSLEGELAAIPTSDNRAGQSVFVLGWRAHGLVHILDSGRWRPFVLAGVGALSSFTGRTGLEQISDDSDFAFHWGAGLKYDVTPRLSLRADFRHLLPPSTRNEGVTNDFELHAGLSFRFGGAPPPPPPPEPAPAPPPEPAPAPPPEPAPEPPPLPVSRDTDGDGILDADDKCPEEPETKNGFQDEDGCADELPKQVQRFTGVISGLRFQPGSDVIQPESYSLLEDTVKMMKEFPEVRLEVSGHTSSDGDEQYNLELSLRRAESVKKYLISKGVEANRLTTRGVGSAQPVAPNDTHEGREKNRRIEFRVIHGALPAGVTQQSE